MHTKHPLRQTLLPELLQLLAGSMQRAICACRARGSRAFKAFSSPLLSTTCLVAPWHGKKCVLESYFF